MHQWDNMNLNAEQICNACEGQFLVEPIDTTVFAIAIKIDSRSVECGDLFVAFSGNNVDGHDYITDVIKNKASVIICEKDLNDEVLDFARENLVSVIKVKSSYEALRNIAIEWRKNIMGKVVGITGSVGKTTAKNLIYETLSIKYNVSANKGNFNNEIGLPITLCSSNFDDDFVVTEMGMSAPGEITDLCEIAQPVWGVITNISEAHIEFFKSIDKIAEAKSELALAIPDNIGTMFLPMDSEYRDFVIDYAKLKERNIKLIYFGGTAYHSEIKAPQVWFEDVELDGFGRPSFIVCTKDFRDSEQERSLCKLNIVGKHNIINACAAIAVGLEADISLTKILENFKQSKPEGGRQEILKSKTGYAIINDAYNANPTSMISSLETFGKIKCDGRRIAFLGDMFELGTYEVTGHKKVGQAVFDNNMDILICVGKLSENIASQAQVAGMQKDKVIHFENVDEAKNYLEQIVNVDDVVLFKASNSMGFQEIVKELIN